MAYLDYLGLAYFKSLLDENYLRTSYDGDTVINGDVTFTNDIIGNLDGKAKKDWKGQQIDSTYIKDISTNDNIGQIVYTKGDGTSNYIMIDIMQGATASAAGKAGLVPAPTISERTKFLRGDGEWSVPTDIYVTQNLINTNDSFPILIGATAGATESQVGTAIAFGTKVSVNPNTHALIADHLILKHPTYRRSNNVSSKVMYTLNFADSDDGNGNNLSEIYGYIDPAANGGEHELGFRLFGNPNVQGVEEIFTYLSVGLSKTNIPYGHAPSTPLPADHNEGTDIITRDWLARNGSETGLVHTSMDETIGGIKTFTAKTVNNSSAGIVTTKLTASDKITGTGTAEISGGSGNTPSLKVTGNETVTGDLSVGGSETVTGNISTTNGTVSAKTGSIGTGGLTVAGPSNLNGKVTAGNGLDVTGNTETDTLTVNGNETVGGTLTVTNKITGNGGIDTTTLHATDDIIADDDMTVGDTLTVNNQILKKTGTNTTQEYVSYVTNQQETKTTVINNLIDPDQGLKLVTKNGQSYIAVKLGDGLLFNTAAGTKGQIDVNFKDPDPAFIQGIVENMIDWSGGLASKPEGYLLAGEYYTDNKGVRRRVTAAQATEQFTGSDGETYYGMKDPNSGKLIVDFSKIDEDTKADILATLDLQYPLTTHLYVTVDPQGVSEDEVTYGTAATDSLTHKVAGKTVNYTFKERKSIPFKTIQGAVNWVSSRVNLANKNAYINVVGSGNTANPKIYEECVQLPQLTTSTGTAIIRTQSGIKDVIVRSKINSSGYYPYCFNANTGSCIWSIYHIKCELLLGEIPTAQGIVTTAIGATTSGSVVHIHGCDIYVHPDTNPSTGSERTEIAGQQYGIRVIDADGGGSIHIHPSELGATIETHLPITNTAGIALDVLNSSRDGAIYFRRQLPSDSMYDANDTTEQRAAKDEIFQSLYVKGSFTRFIYTWQFGKTNVLGGAGFLVKFPVAANSTAIGRPYVSSSGGAIVSSAKVYLDEDPESASYHTYYYVFPGDGVPSIDANTNCWITVPNNYPPAESNNG